MKLYQFITHDVNSSFLYLFILFADLDFSSIADYTVKALIGGAVWFGFKVFSDWYSQWSKARKRRCDEKKDK